MVKEYVTTGRIRIFMVLKKFGRFKVLTLPENKNVRNCLYLMYMTVNKKNQEDGELF